MNLVDPLTMDDMDDMDDMNVGCVSGEMNDSGVLQDNIYGEGEGKGKGGGGEEEIWAVQRELADGALLHRKIKRVAK